MSKSQIPRDMGQKLQDLFFFFFPLILVFSSLSPPFFPFLFPPLLLLGFFPALSVETNAEDAKCPLPHDWLFCSQAILKVRLHIWPALRVEEDWCRRNESPPSCLACSQRCTWVSAPAGDFRDSPVCCLLCAWSAVCGISRGKPLVRVSSAACLLKV